MRKYQYYNTNDDNDRDIYAANWGAQTFTPATDHIIGKVKLKLFRVGDPGTITVSIKPTSGGKPVGADLCSGIIEGTDLTLDTNGEWYEISLGDGFDLDVGAQYAIAVRAPSGDASNKVSWRADITDPTFTGGTFVSSSDSGVDWSVVSGVDCMFEEWGVGPASPTTVVWGNLFKSQISAEKIEEAIARFIQNHEDDPDAHIETGESLQSHKAAAIIDHLAASIIADKIKDFEIVAKKIRSFADLSVDVGAFADFSTFLEHVTQTGSTRRDLHLSEVKTGATISSIASTYLNFNMFYGFSGKFRIDFRAYFMEILCDANAYFKIDGSNYLPDTGTAGQPALGFRVVNDDGECLNLKIYGFVRGTGGVTETLLYEVAEQDEKHWFLSIERDGNNFKFYIDDEYIATIVRSDAPIGGHDYLVHAIKNDAAFSAMSVLQFFSYSLRY